MWQNSLGHCVLKAEFPKGKKELAVSLFQVGLFQAIMLCFVFQYSIIIIDFAYPSGQLIVFWLYCMSCATDYCLDAL